MMKFYFCESIGVSILNQNSLQILNVKNGTRKNIYNIYKMVFRPGKLQNFNLHL